MLQSTAVQRRLRRVRRVLTANRASPAPRELWATQRRALAVAPLLVRVFYVALLCDFLSQYDGWDYWLSLDQIRLLWPLAWFKLVGVRVGIAIVIFGAPASAILAIALPGVRACRVLVAAFTLMYGAFQNSFGASIGSHGEHAWFWAAAIFVLLPDGPMPDSGDASPGARRRAQRYLRVFWAAQAAVLLFYSLSGSFKVAAGLVQMWQGQANTFSPDALARHAAARMLEGARVARYTVGPWLVDHPRAGWPFYLAAVYLEVFSFIVAFRPAVQRAWGVAMICVHLGIYFTLTIMFSWQIMLVGLLLVCTPTAPQRISLRQMVWQLPLLGDLLSWSAIAGRALRRRRLPTPLPILPAPIPPAPAAATELSEAAVTPL
jgi:hypothetical protein